MKLSSVQTAALLAALPSTTLAGLPQSSASATPTVTLLLPYAGASSTYLGSVITTIPTGTVYAVTCAPLPASASASATDVGDFCGPEFTITQGPSMWELQYTIVGEATLSAHCDGDIVNTKALTCTESEGGPSVTGTDAGVQTTVIQSSDYSSVFGAVTITAGAELLTFSSSATSSGASSSQTASQSSNSKASFKASGSLTTMTGTVVNTGSATGASTKPTSTGAAGANMVQKGAVVGAAGVVLAALAL